MRTLTPEQEQARTDRRNRFKAIVKQVAGMSDADRSALAASMPVLSTVEGRALTLHNSCLIALQCPAATIVGGFRQWLKAGRVVRKGEHGISIWAPTMRKSKDTMEPLNTVDGTDTTGEKKRLNFLMVTVFDISQTAELSAEKGRVAA